MLAVACPSYACTAVALASVPLLRHRGGPGLNARGDSLLFAGPFNQAIQGRVTAPAGRTLDYLCVIHPWMQGSIAVR
jgi:hypothetical protein